MTLFWLSFCDPDRPKGSQFLGACIVEGQSGVPMSAIQTAWLRKCNPGGEVQIAEILPSLVKHVAPKWMNRLLTREEAQEFDREMKPHGAN